MAIRSVTPFILLLLTLALCRQSHAQEWMLLPSSPTATIRFDDVLFIDPRTGWVIDSGGFIYKTTDGGISWTRLIHDQTDLNERVLFRSLAFADENVGWTGSLGFSSQNPNFRNILYETRDGGMTWTDITDRITGTSPAGLCGMWAVNEHLVYGVGRYGLGPSTFLKTTDGGLTWTSRDMTDIAGVLIDVYFFDEAHGIIIGSTAPADGSLDAWEDLDTVNAAVFMTSDGGETWTIVHQTTRFHEWGWKISFPTPLVGYISTQGKPGAKVLKTTDGGVTWTETIIPQGFGGSAIGFVNEDRGWTGGDGTLRTADGGITWEEAGFGSILNRIRVIGDSLAYAVGDRVYKYASTSTAAEPADVPSAFALEQNYPNPFNPITTITYEVNVTSHVLIRVHDVFGRHVQTLVNRPNTPGRHEVVWNGTDDTGSPAPSGVYFYSIQSGSLSEARPMTLIR